MTELQFLIDLLLNHKLNQSTKKLVADRIGSVEESLRIGGNRQNVPRGTIVHPSVLQSPSTQAILDRDGPPPIPTIVEETLPKPTPAANRIIGGMVNTGNGTKGPRKF